MITIVYVSQASEPMDEAALSRLLQTARTRNDENAVTGLLLYAYESFMQQLEGEAAAVEAIFASIERDRRHTGLRLLARREVSERRYGAWSMGFESPDAETLARRLPGYRPTTRQPLVDSTLVSDSVMAETLLELAASSGHVDAG